MKLWRLSCPCCESSLLTVQAEIARYLARILSESVIPLRRELATRFRMLLCLLVLGMQRRMSIMQGVIRLPYMKFDADFVGSQSIDYFNGSTFGSILDNEQ